MRSTHLLHKTETTSQDVVRSRQITLNGLYIRWNNL